MSALCHRIVTDSKCDDGGQCSPLDDLSRLDNKKNGATTPHCHVGPPLRGLIDPISWNQRTSAQQTDTCHWRTVEAKTDIS